MSARPTGILFLCVHNSARSQLAEALARQLAPPGVEIYSAGSDPGRLNPRAVQALAEIGLDAAGQQAKSTSDVPAERIGTVVTLCEEEVCPTWAGDARRIHWPLPDPAAVEGTPEEQLAAFRATRDEIRDRIRELFQS